ncbi:MAG: class I SAM-dependent methyltransferase [Planctomycetota bacterium]|nr:class I SAM-dependent methyltransferase [Planctomycetota bacterium]
MQTDLTRVQTGYDLWSKIYDDESNPLIAMEEREIWARVGDVRGLDVLDLGCGTGRHSLGLLKRGARVTAVDFSKKMLERAREKTAGATIRFIEQDLLSPLPFGENAFDLVVCGLVLEHFSHLEPIFDEARRVLKADPESGLRIMPGSINHSLDEFARAPLSAGFVVEEFSSFAVDERLACEHPRAEKYLGVPILLLLVLKG